MSRAGTVLAVALVAWAPALSELAAQSRSSVTLTANSGPVAISMRPGAGPLVLQGDGVIVSLDDNAVGKRVYRVPAKYFVADLATAPAASGITIALTVNARNEKDFSSWVVQVRPDGREIWTWLPQRGIYVGLAVDGPSGHIYASNSSNNAIYRLDVGDQKGKPTEVAHVDAAERIGAVALDARGRRLFVADMAAGHVHVVPLDGRGDRTHRDHIDVPNAEEIRSLAWSAKTQRLYIADAGQEAVFVVDPKSPAAVSTIKDKRFREPAGLAAADDGVWLVDEGAKAAFHISEESRVVGPAVAWNAKK